MSTYTKLMVIRTKKLDDNNTEIVLANTRIINILPGTYMNNAFVASGVQEPWVRLIENRESKLKYGNRYKVEKTGNICPTLVKDLKPMFIVDDMGIGVALSYYSTYINIRGLPIYYEGTINRDWLCKHHTVYNNINDIKEKDGNCYIIGQPLFVERNKEIIEKKTDTVIFSYKVPHT